MIHPLLNISQAWQSESGFVSMCLLSSLRKVGRFVEAVIMSRYYPGAGSERTCTVFAGYTTNNLPTPHDEGRGNTFMERCLALLQADKTLRTATR